MRPPKSRKRSSRPVASKSAFGWKEHPLAVAVGTGVATLLVCVTIYGEVVLPTRLGKYEMETERLLSRVANLEAEEKQTLAVNSELLAQLTSQAEVERRLREELYEARIGALFSPGSPYPNGLALARIGSNRSEVVTALSRHHREDPNDSPDILAFELVDHPFERVTYYFNDTSGEVTHFSIRLPFNLQTPDGFLLRKLTEAFGSPIEGPRRSYHLWHVDEFTIFKSNDYSITVHRYGYKPAFWPDH